MLATLSGSFDQELLLRNEYLVTKNRIRSVKTEFLSKMILCGESSLRHCLENYVNHVHAERNHQSTGNVILFPAPEDRIGERAGDIQTREGLGGILKCYCKEAACVS